MNSAEISAKIWKKKAFQPTDNFDLNQLDHVIDPVGQSLARLNFENPKICQIMIIFTWDMFDHVMFSLVFRLIWNFTRKESKIMKISLSENGLGLARNNNFEFTFRKKYKSSYSVLAEISILMHLTCNLSQVIRSIILCVLEIMFQ